VAGSIEHDNAILLGGNDRDGTLDEQRC